MSNHEEITRTIRWNLTTMITEAQAQAVAAVLDAAGYRKPDAA